ncbi:uncharacterized protein UMAG_12119 [Mycosarcoma maydis]|uniref:Uncharacterized protein n=1 Tax=Mycosarcoma maydis TaxID=5270 RepID=A0A0D1E4V8_MYCMD|nr:uncharacterized protein UMAG_12119 [Ustilago maydis 521]KIS71029.1 hypothetical protein UMAG_12119 [Ustilago maydis 521]|eukprot:XP_011387486.1 hypothetical protein UMAG_12119 [Ustilago maydis 521]
MNASRTVAMHLLTISSIVGTTLGSSTSAIANVGLIFALSHFTCLALSRCLHLVNVRLQHMFDRDLKLICLPFSYTISFICALHPDVAVNDPLTTQQSTQALHPPYPSSVPSQPTHTSHLQKPQPDTFISHLPASPARTLVSSPRA